MHVLQHGIVLERNFGLPAPSPLPTSTYPPLSTGIRKRRKSYTFQGNLYVHAGTIINRAHVYGSKYVVST
jgi:hypothetical protein